MAHKKVTSKKKVLAVKKDLVFIPVVYGVYKKNKMNLLNTQVKVLECIKRINNLQILQKQKEALKLEFYRNLSEAMRLYHHTQSLLPVVIEPQPAKKIEKSVEIAINYQDSNSSFSYSKKISQPDDLDSELKEIQEKLNALNSSREFY
jgi:hypothetical protein